MPITKNVLPLLNLAKYDVYVEDTSPTSEYFRISRLPSVFTGGRNSFVLGASPFLEDGSEIKIEIIDAYGNPIYHTCVENYTEGGANVISVEIYDTTAPGFATIIVMGKLQSTADGTPIPPKWNGVYNVRWHKTILVDYNLKNTSPIIFKNNPEILLSESIYYNILSSSYNILRTPFSTSLDLTSYLKNGEQAGYVITDSSISGSFFSNYRDNVLITGSIRLANSVGGVAVPITQILNRTTALSDGYFINSPVDDSIIQNITLQSGSYMVSLYGTQYPITNSLTVQYTALTESVINIPISYANMIISNLDTVSGEIHKLKIYAKPVTDVGAYKLITEVPVETNEILVYNTTPAGTSLFSYTSSRGEVPVFSEPEYLDKYFYAGTLTKNTSSNGSIYPIDAPRRYYDIWRNDGDGIVVIGNDNRVLMSAIYALPDISASGENSKFSNQVSESGYYIGTKNGYTVFSNSEYTLTFDAHYSSKSGSIRLIGTTPKVDVYVAGVIYSPNNTPALSLDFARPRTILNDANPLGQKIGELTTDGGDYDRWFFKQQFNFKPLVNNVGTIGLRFVVSNGFWYFTNISLKPASDPQFSPDEIRLAVPNREFNNELLQYKVEFFDINNNSVNTVATSLPVFFSGSAIDFGTLPPPPPPPPLPYTLTGSKIYALSGSTTQSWHDVLWVTSSTLSTWLIGGSRGFATSSDGVTWGEAYNIGSGSLGEIHNIVWVDHLSILAAAMTITDEADQRIEILTSSDASNWAPIARIPTESGTGSRVHTLKYANDINSLVLIQGTTIDDKLIFYTSSDAQTWEFVHSQSFGGGSGTSVLLGKGLSRNTADNYWITPRQGSAVNVIVGLDVITTSYFYTSSNLISWMSFSFDAASNPLPAYYYLDAVMTSNNIFFASNQALYYEGDSNLTYIENLDLIGTVGIKAGGTVYSSSLFSSSFFSEGLGGPGAGNTQSLYVTDGKFSASVGYSWSRQFDLPLIQYALFNPYLPAQLPSQSSEAQWSLLRSNPTNDLLIVQGNYDYDGDLTYDAKIGTHSVTIANYG